MAASDAEQNPFHMGAVLAEVVGVLRRNMVMFAALALVMTLPILAVDYAPFSVSTWVHWLITIPTTVAIAGVLHGMIVCGVALERDRGWVTFRDCVGYGSALAIPVATVSLLAIALICVGLILLIVPGLFLVVRLWVIVPVVVLERPDIVASLARSARLATGAGWQVFGLVAAIEVVFYLVRTGLSYVQIEPLALTFVVDWVLFAAEMLTFGLTAAVTYFHLRDMREGNATSQLARVFE